MNWYEIFYILGLIIPFILCGFWLKHKGRSLWHLLYLPILGIIAIMIYAFLRNYKTKEESDKIEL